MKSARIFLFFPLLLGAFMVHGQADSSQHRGRHQFGFAGGALMQVGLTELGQGLYTSFGLGAGLLVDRRLLIAAYGMNLPGSGLTDHVTDGSVIYDAEFSMQHGGLWLMWSFVPKEDAHIFTALQLGGGTAHRRFKATEDTPDTAVLPENKDDAVMTIAPMCGMEFSMFRSYRPSIYGGYRFVQGLDLPQMGATDANGIFFGFTFLLGGFGGRH